MESKPQTLEFDTRQFRADLGFTQAEFAKVVNVRRDTITSWDTKKRKPGNTGTRLLQVIKKAQDLGLFDTLFGEYLK